MDGERRKQPAPGQMRRRSPCRRLGRRLATAAAAAALAGAAGAWAAETLTYSYDARGRLIKVERSGTVNEGVATSYEHDKANNRIVKTTTGVP